MSYAAYELRLALEVLGVTMPCPALPLDQRTELRTALHLANTLLGAAEREIIQAEMDAVQSALPQDEIDALITESEDDADAVMGWTEGLGDGQCAVLHWRAARLRRALVQELGGLAEADPALAAACDAAALTVVLLGYREASELQFADTECAEACRGVPETSLQAAITLKNRISDIVGHLAD